MLSRKTGLIKYADGGIVAAQGNIATPNFNNSLIVPFASLTSAINNLNTNLSNKQTNTLTPQSNDVNNYISVSISIDGQNNTAATSSVNSQSRNNTKPDNKDNAKQLEKNFTAKMGEFLNKEMKQGGSIWTFVNSKTGR
jgi:alpha-acetolactate decarboxylase